MLQQGRLLLEVVIQIVGQGIHGHGLLHLSVTGCPPFNIQKAVPGGQVDILCGVVEVHTQTAAVEWKPH